jgi:hypothetical protein
MYGWIWRKLPFGVPGKIIGSVLLLVGAAAALWFWVFPATAPLMPFNQSTITEEDGGNGDQPGGGSSPSPTFDPSDYELEESPGAGDGD